MIQTIEFHNFRVLRNATLPLSPFTLLLGANGSGKSTVLHALKAASAPSTISHQSIRSSGIDLTQNVSLVLQWASTGTGKQTEINWPSEGKPVAIKHIQSDGTALPIPEQQELTERLRGIRIYSLESAAIAQPVQIQSALELGPNGANLPGVLDRLRDQSPERWAELNREMVHWLPEYDQIIMRTTSPGQKSFSLRERQGAGLCAAESTSQGTLLALALLTIAYLPDAPSIVGFEEPDRGLHPRLLRELRDAFYRLSYPKNFGETREPVQVIVTTHSPYMLDLYRDRLDEVVLAQKTNLDVRFERLSDLPHAEEILGKAPLGEVWYSGILGGVPARP